ncbi:unnamed protein product [Adineta steineri]|uniref:Uncharacterized protein n=1 Tax=Adineta steineri TaxID=433720 RepID=A0A819T8F3_9BILA|nr:unnamed protein product [Adineta steineri]CAF4077473.1 unnamed protein product [Adineta steineri]
MSLHFNKLVHRFSNTHSDNVLINSIDNSHRIEGEGEGERSSWGDLRMTRASLEGVFPELSTQLSFACREVKRNEEQNLIIIGYDMTLHNIINWNQAKRKFEHFLARHCKIANTYVDVLGIVWDVNTCWYIMNATPRLRQALIPRQAPISRQALIPRQSNTLLHVSLGIVVGAGALVLLVTIFNPARK